MGCVASEGLVMEFWQGKCRVSLVWERQHVCVVMAFGVTRVGGPWQAERGGGDRPSGP